MPFQKKRIRRSSNCTCAHTKTVGTRYFKINTFIIEFSIINTYNFALRLIIDSVKHRMSCIFTTQEFVDLFVKVSNKFWYIEDETYNFKIGTREYDMVKANTDEWYEVLMNQIMRAAEYAHNWIFCEDGPLFGEVIL